MWCYCELNLSNKFWWNLNQWNNFSFEVNSTFIFDWCSPDSFLINFYGENFYHKRNFCWYCNLNPFTVVLRLGCQPLQVALCCIDKISHCRIGLSTQNHIKGHSCIICLLMEGMEEVPPHGGYGWSARDLWLFWRTWHHHENACLCPVL